MLVSSSFQNLGAVTKKAPSLMYEKKERGKRKSGNRLSEEDSV